MKRSCESAPETPKPLCAIATAAMLFQSGGAIARGHGKGECSQESLLEDSAAQDFISLFTGWSLPPVSARRTAFTFRS